MKRIVIVSLLMIAAIGLMSLFAVPAAQALGIGAPPIQETAPPPAIPAEFSAALLGVVAFLITQGLKSLSALLAKYPLLAWIDISGWGSVIAGFVVTGLLFYINMGLGYVPPIMGPLLPFLFAFLTSLLTAYGTHKTVKTLTAVVAKK